MAQNCTRRNVLTLAAATALGAAALPWTASAQSAEWPLRSGIEGLDEQHLWIRQAGRSETIHARIRYNDGSLDPTGIADLAWLFRDWRDNDQYTWIDPRLFDLLATVQTFATYVHARPIELVLNSGYRTPRRNASVEGAAVNSQHIHGRAADISVSGVPHQGVRDAAEASGAPGLGRYASFTHLDVGPPGRRWRG
ncbi:MAG: DUF882 domain-containing protein [Pseudomonadota bacterium]